MIQGVVADVVEGIVVRMNAVVFAAVEVRVLAVVQKVGEVVVVADVFAGVKDRVDAVVVSGVKVMVKAVFCWCRS